LARRVEAECHRHMVAGRAERVKDFDTSRVRI
jgi:hypothetical protein